MDERHTYRPSWWARLSCAILVPFCLLLPFFFLTTIVRAEDAITCEVEPVLASDASLTQKLREGLRKAQSEVLVSLYSLNNPLLAEELVSLAKKGVRVRVKIDAEKATKRKAGELIARMRDAGVSIQAVAVNGRNHNKFTVIDGERVITGSYNWTKKADQNWENLLFLKCPKLARRYAAEWERIE